VSNRNTHGGKRPSAPADRLRSTPKSALERAARDQAARRHASPPEEGDLRGEPTLFDFDEIESPPLSGKVHPSAELSDAVPTLDDEVRDYRHHPNESGSVEFDVNPYSGDAAADLASDFGSEFLEGATRGQDLSDVIMSHDDAAGELPSLLDTESEGEREDAARVLINPPRGR
jgi:hypothetical protein